MDKAGKTIDFMLKPGDLEGQGSQQDLVERRKALRDLHPGLYATDMKTR